MITAEFTPDLRDVTKVRDAVEDMSLFTYYNGHMRYTNVFCFRLEDEEQRDEIIDIMINLANDLGIAPMEVA